MSNKQQITSLTEAQKAKIPEYVEKWIKIGCNTDRLNYDETLDVVNEVQVNILKRKKTPVVIFDNPIEAWVACNYSVHENFKPNQLKDKVDEFFSGNKIKLETFTIPYLKGSFDVSSWAFYDFFKDEVGIDFGEALKNYQTWRSTHKLGLIFPLVDVCIVSEKPSLIKMNEQNRAHCDGGPAISYAGRGDLNIYMLNGVRVPDWLVTEHSTKIPLSRYNEISNADVKMEFVRKVGIERMLETGNKLDSYQKYEQEWYTKSQYELWDMNHLFEGVNYAPHLKMLNQTTGVWHVEAVSPACRTVADAIKERHGGLDLDIVSIA